MNPNDDIIAATNTQLAYFTGNANAPATPNIGAVAYTVNLATDATTLVGATDNGTAARDLAIAGAMSVVTATRNQTDLAAGFSLCPNPVTSSIRFAFTLTSTVQIELGVFDALGRRAIAPRPCCPAGAHDLPLQVSSLTLGLYLVRLLMNGQHATSRQIIVE